MNAHGSFDLFDKNWDCVEYPKDETMIALKENDQARNSINLTDFNCYKIMQEKKY